MYLEPIFDHWTIQQRNILPIAYFHGESNSLNAQPVLIHEMFSFFELAEKFQGIPYQDPYIYPSNMKISFSFAIIFKTPADLRSFTEELNGKKR